LEIYLKTLIRFIARDSDFHESINQNLANEMRKYDKDIHFNTPMINTVVKIKKLKEKDQNGSKYLLYTKPEIKTI